MGKDEKHVVVMGGGVSGLMAALKVLEGGQKVILIEKFPFLGGTAASIDIPEGRRVSVGYHQIVGSDHELTNVLQNFNLQRRIHWKKTHIATLVGKKNVNLASIKDMLFFQNLPVQSRIIYMLFGVRCLLTKDWSRWRNRSVTEFIIKWADKKVLENIFKPLVDIKFGFSTDQADAAWLGLRLSHGEGNVPFGFMPNASWTEEMCLKITQRIKNLGGQIETNSAVTSIKLDRKKNIISVATCKNKEYKALAVISTLPPPALYPILQKSLAPKSWLKPLRKIRYISCYSLLAGLPFVPFPEYWTIFLSPRRIFGGCFTLSHLNESLITDTDRSVVNIFTNVSYGNYPWSEKEYEKLAIKDLSEAVGYKVKPNWAKVTIIRQASPIFDVGYENLPEKLGKNLYLAGIYRTYPKFSSTGEALASGEKGAKNFLHDFSNI